MSEVKLYQEAEASINEVFFKETHDKSTTLDLSKIIGAKLKADDSAKDVDYYGKRDGVVHVSTLYGCLRGVLHELLGTKPDEVDPRDEMRKLGVFKAGNLFEEYIVNALGDMMLDRQTEYIYKMESGLIVTGRDDGTLLYEGVRRMLEAKSVHSDSFWYREKEGTLVAWQNQIQIQTYMWLRRILPNLFIVANPDDFLNGESINKDNVKETIYTNLSREELIEFKKWQESSWLMRSEKPDNTDLNGIFSYISKDDCTIISVPVKFNPRIIEETVKPALDIISAEYNARKGLAENRRLAREQLKALPQDADITAVTALQKEIDTLDKQIADMPNVPAPALAVYSSSKTQWEKNWLCKYNKYANSSYGSGWMLEAESLVKQKNKERMMPTPPKKEKPTITVVG